MDDVEAHVAGPRDAADGVEVRPVVVHEGAGSVKDPLHLLDPLVEEPERRRVREHEAGRRLVDLPAEILEVDVAAGVRRHLDELVARHRHARRVRAVSGVGHDDPSALLVLSAVGEVRVHEHEARQLALRAGRGLERHRVQAADLREDLLEPPHELERSLRAVLVLQRVKVGEARVADHDLVDARVVLHRAGAEGVEAGVDAEVASRQLGEVTHELELGRFRKPRRLGAP